VPDSVHPIVSRLKIIWTKYYRGSVPDSVHLIVSRLKIIWTKYYRGSVPDSVHLIVSCLLYQLLHIISKQSVESKAEVQPDIT